MYARDTALHVEEQPYRPQVSKAQSKEMARAAPALETTSMTTPRRADSPGPRIYYVNPLDLPHAMSWLAVFDHAASLNFDTVLTAPFFRRQDQEGSIFASSDYGFVDPALKLSSGIEECAAFLCDAARLRGISLMMDVAFSGEGSAGGDCSGSLDPRRSPSAPWRHSGQSGDLDRLLGVVSRLSAAGISGFRYLGLDELSEADLKLVASPIAARNQPLRLVYTPGTDFAFRKKLQGLGFDGTFSSLAWWNMRDGWLLEEHRLQRQLGQQVAFPEAPFARRLAHGTESREIRQRKCLRSLRLSAELGDGILIPMGFEYGAVLPQDSTRGSGQDLRMMASSGEFDISAAVREVNGGMASRKTVSPYDCQTSDRVSVITFSDAPDLRIASEVTFLAINRDLRNPSPYPQDIISTAAPPFFPDLKATLGRLLPGEVGKLPAAARPAIALEILTSPEKATAQSQRIAIENIEPQVDGGRFPVKRVVGDLVCVQADIFSDGHDHLAASLLHRGVGDDVWHESPLQLDNNDRWVGAFRPDRLGRFEFCVEAWKNPFAIYRYELSKKAEAGLDLTLELIEGEALVGKAVASTAGEANATLHAKLIEIADSLAKADPTAKTRLLLSSHVSDLMSDADQRPFRVRSPPYFVDAERVEASFASWYQVFPRSQSGEVERHGTFDDVIGRLPAIREMGFDVLYFPPIHPIGSTNRKGRNNSLTSTPNDPGSPYAIGSSDGGHDAIHPQLGGFESFRRLIAATRKEGLELALDLAIQASPDHPWLIEHPGWFEWRPNGTIRFAENPPKKYEDIVNVDFYAQDAVPALWEELRDIVQLWVNEGVKLFRVDNPHTKPFPFWEWLIGDIRARHPEVVFLSEAFTRPKVMYRLAKVGFSQSYTYFTWRNTRWELEQYMSEITQTEAKEFFRPHFFVNTHDINPDFLQNAPRPAFVIRASLAATLSGLWGVYNGFELCEGRPDAKRKEYADSEKYEIRAWDYDRPGNIKSEITTLNRIRRENPALHSHLGLTLLNSSNPNVMFFEKAAPGRHNVLLIAICLNPHAVEESTVEIPLWKSGQDDGGTIEVDDLVSGSRFSLTGKWQTLRLDPSYLPFAIWRVRTGEI